MEKARVATPPKKPGFTWLDKFSAVVAGGLTLALLASVIWPASSSDASETVLFLGRFHPILVHLPIGFFLALLVLEIFDLFFRSAVLHHATYIMAWLAGGAALLAVIAGVFLAYPGNYSEELLFRHRLLGSLTAVCIVWILAWKVCRPLRQTHGWSFIYHPLLLVTLLFLAGAGHYGGSLTHGSDYLTAYMPSSLRPLLGLPEPVTPPPLAVPDDPRDAPVFHTLIDPILKANCVGCHGAERQRAGLRLDSHASLLEGGESGADLNLIPKSLRLPLEDDRHMPPQEKAQLTEDEIALLTWWIRAGASEDARIRDLETTGQISRILEERFDLVPDEDLVPMLEWEEIEETVADLRERLNVNVQQIARDDPALEISFILRDTVFGDEELAQLDPLQANFRVLNLSRSEVTDEGLAHVGEMKNLERIDLSNTDVTDSGMAYLSGLPRLKYLNLHGTQVSDAGLVHVERISSLRKVFLWQTAVSDEGIARLQQNLFDEGQVSSWEAEIEELRQQIESARVEIDAGETVAKVREAGGEPINETCPVSGKEIDPARTATYEEQVIAFCCGDCLARFEENPEAVIDTLNLAQDEG